MQIEEFVFLFVALLTVAPCAFVAFSRNILHSAFSLFFTFLGTSGLYFLLGADYLAVVQIIVYIGGVLVLLLFAILLTRNIEEVGRTNTSSLPRSVVAGLLALAAIGLVGWGLFGETFLPSGGMSADFSTGTTHDLGRLLLGKYLLPFEVVSMLLLAVLIGSLAVARRSVK